MLKGKPYLLHDRDPLFTAEFLRTLADGGVASVKLPAAESQSELPRPTVGTDHQGILPGADDLVRRRGGAESDCRIHRA